MTVDWIFKAVAVREVLRTDALRAAEMNLNPALDRDVKRGRNL
jgi:hypothetical protein